jgi:hypothetical protein
MKPGGGSLELIFCFKYLELAVLWNWFFFSNTRNRRFFDSFKRREPEVLWNRILQ